MKIKSSNDVVNTGTFYICKIGFQQLAQYIIIMLCSFHVSINRNSRSAKRWEINAF